MSFPSLKIMFSHFTLHQFHLARCNEYMTFFYSLSYKLSGRCEWMDGYYLGIYYNSNNLQTHAQHFTGRKIKHINILPFKNYSYYTHLYDGIDYNTRSMHNRSLKVIVQRPAVRSTPYACMHACMHVCM
jgi:hypothetical protein